MKVTSDKLLGYDKAQLPDSVLAFYRFHNDERMFIGRADERSGSLRAVSNDKYRYVRSLAEFKRLAAEFVREGTE